MSSNRFAPIAVRYDHGLYLPELDLWLDPQWSKPRAFVSHAHSDHFARHGLTICTSPTARLIVSRYGEMGRVQELAYRQIFVDRDFSIQLLPAGHILGSAMLHITRLKDGATLLYTGDFKLRQGLTSESAEILPADLLILETTFGRPRYRFPPREKVIAEVLMFIRETLEDGGIPVLLGYSLGKSQEILAALKGSDIPVMLHSSLVKLTEIYEDLHHIFPRWRVFEPNEAEGHILIFPPSASKSLALRKLKNCRTALLSGWALTPGARFRYQVDEVFPLSDHADYTELLACVEQTGARLIYTVHGYTTEFACDLRMRGYEAWSLGHDDQLEFWLPVSSTQEGEDESVTKLQAEENTAAADSFLAWVQTCENVSAESSRLRKQEHLAAYLRNLDKTHLPLVVRWFSTILDDPRIPAPPLQVGWATIRRVLIDLSGLQEREYQAISSSQNDAGRTAFLVLERANMAGRLDAFVGKALLLDIAAAFGTLRLARGSREKTEVLKQMLSALTPLEGSYVVRLLTGELRIGSRGGLAEEAIACAFMQSTDAIREAAMICGDLGCAAQLAREGNLNKAQPTLFVPIKVMLASPEETAEAIWKRLSGDDGKNNIWLEDKFDGIRAQVHGGGGQGEIYTRDLRCVTGEFPEIAQALAHLSEKVILDGEIVAYAEDKKLTFQDLQKRLGRKEQGDLFIPSDVSVHYIAFDILWKNGTSLLKESLEIRRQHLDALILPHLLRRIDVTYAASVQEIEVAFLSARRRGNEGLIAKDPRSLYTPGRRGKTWLKLKKTFLTLDVVVVKVEQGHGKRSHVLSDYTFAVRDENRGELRIIGKAYSGLTDLEIEQLTEHFKEHTRARHDQVYIVTPNIVLEVAFDSIQPSARHDSGLALRFPRIRAIRWDKKVSEIDTLDYARKLAGVSTEE